MGALLLIYDFLLFYHIMLWNMNYSLSLSLFCIILSLSLRFSYRKYRPGPLFSIVSFQSISWNLSLNKTIFSFESELYYFRQFCNFEKKKTHNFFEIIHFVFHICLCSHFIDVLECEICENFLEVENSAFRTDRRPHSDGQFAIDFIITKKDLPTLLTVLAIRSSEKVSHSLN